MDKSNINVHIGVLNSDQEPSRMPPGSYFAALNAVPGEDRKDLLLNKRERSNRLFINLPQGFKSFGHIYVGLNDVVAAIGNGSVSQIVMVKNNGDFDVLIDAPLNFQDFVDFTYRVRKGCETTIYFTDCINYVRTVNLDDLNQYKINGSWDVGLMDLFRPYKIPCIVNGSVTNFGGNVRYGSYNVSIQYLDADLNPTISLYSSHVVTVSESQHGFFNFDVNPAVGKVLSNKSIRFDIQGLDQSFPYYRLIIAEASTGTGAVNKFWLTYNQSINNTVFVFDGNTTNYTETTRGEMLTQKISWERASYIDQVESNLVLGGLKGSEYPYCDWQKFASKICVEYVVEELNAEAYLKKGMDTGVWDNTYMADEVYAPAIVFVDKRGRHHPGFPIPGRGLNSYCKNCDDESPCDDLAIKLKVRVVAPQDSNVHIEISIPVVINGMPDVIKHTYRAMLVMGDEWEFEVNVKFLCQGDIVQIGVPTWENLNPGDDYFVFLSATLISNPNSTTKGIDSDDDFVYPSWSKDMSFILDEAAYRYAISEYNRINGKNVIYGNGSMANLLELKNVPGLPKRWQIYNTAEKGGKLAYWQTNGTVYENPLRDCGIDDYWGVDACGNRLEGTPIRHVKMPDRTLEPLYSNGKLRRIGLKFSNIEYPHPDIIGHYIVMAKRDKYNRTVIDKGIMNPTTRVEEFVPQGRFIEGFSYWSKDNSPDNHNYTSPKLHLEQEHVRGSYIKVENDYLFHNHLLFGESLSGKGIGLFDTDILIDARLFIQRDSAAPRTRNLRITDQYTIGPLSVYEKPDRTVVNNAQSTAIAFIETDNTLVKTHFPNEDACIEGPDDTKIQPGYAIPYVAIKAPNNVHPVLENIVYYRTHNCVKTGDTTVFGDIFMSRMDFVHHVLREQYKLGRVLFGGYVGYNPVYDQMYNAGEFTLLVEDRCIDRLQQNTNFVGFAGELLTVWVESEVEWQLRPQGTSPENTIYKWYGLFDKRDPLLLSHFMDKIAKKVHGEKELYYELQVNSIQEFYLYNFDYRRLNFESAYIPLPSTYNCCSKCLEEFPNRVAYSETSFQEEISDHYRIFKANNFRDIPAERGKITDLWRDGNLLFVHTEEGLWQVPYGYQEVERAGIVTYIGDGAFFSQPPRLMVDVDTGTAGSLNRQSTIKTPQGVFFVDEISSVPYMFAGGLKPITGDQSSWFSRNLKSWFNPRFLELFGEEPPKNLAYNIAAYDESNNRIILSKIDYEFKPGAWEYTDGKFYFNGLEVTIGDPLGFINRSFTISYSFDKQGWVSYHTWVPEYFFYNKDRFYAVKNSSIWGSDGDGYGNFFGKDEPFVIDIPISQGDVDKIINDLSIGLRTEVIKPSGVVPSGDFFDEAIIYNSWQSTGLRKINVKSSFLTEKQGFINAVRRLNDWYINEFRDMIISNDEAIFYENRSLLPAEGYVDKLPNPNATSELKPFWERELFKDRWLGVRLSVTGKREVQFIVRSVINTENITE